MHTNLVGTGVVNALTMTFTNVRRSCFNRTRGAKVARVCPTRHRSRLMARLAVCSRTLIDNTVKI